MGLNTSGETMQSLSNASCRCAHAGVIFSPPHLGLSIWYTGWKRLIQQEVTGCNEGQKRRYSRCKRGLLDIVLGGTAQQVSKAAPCLVVLVSPQPEGSSREPSL